MTQDQDAETVARLEALEAKATGSGIAGFGWRFRSTADQSQEVFADNGAFLAMLFREDDARQYAALRNQALPLIRSLSARLAAAEAENARMREALAFYADPKRYHGPPYRHDVTRDGGQIARAALEPRT